VNEAEQKAFAEGLAEGIKLGAEQVLAASTAVVKAAMESAEKALLEEIRKTSGDEK